MKQEDLLDELLIDYNDDAAQRCDTLAEHFYNDTGLMAPGKSRPLEMCNQSYNDEAVWREWLKNRRAAIYEALKQRVFSSSSIQIDCPSCHSTITVNVPIPISIV